MGAGLVAEAMAAGAGEGEGLTTLLGELAVAGAAGVLPATSALTVWTANAGISNGSICISVSTEEPAEVFLKPIVTLYGVPGTDWPERLVRSTKHYRVSWHSSMDG